MGIMRGVGLFRHGSVRERLVAVAASALLLASMLTGAASLLAPPAAQASTTPLLEFQRDAARASWVSGPGGNYFGIWECPQGSLAVGVRGAETGGYVYRFGLVCRYVNLDTGTWGAYAYTAVTHAGATTELLCPSGQALVRVGVRTMSGYGYPIASETEPYCQTLDFGNVSAVPRQIPQLTGTISPAPNRYFGTPHGSLYGTATCGAGKFVVAIDGRRGALLDGLGIYCGGFTARAASISSVTLTGATQFGAPVTAAPTASGGPAPTMTYQWYSCATADASSRATVPAAPECELITGATGSSYRPQITDEGRHLRVAATATNYFGTSTLVSPTTPAPSVPAPSLDLAAASDSGTSATDNHTNDSTPTIHLGLLVPTAQVTVTATKTGSPAISCTTLTAVGIPSNATGAPATGQCDLPELSDGTWTVTTSQTYTPSGSATPITSTTTSLPIVVDTTAPVLAAINLKNGTTVINDGDANAAVVANTYTLTYPSATDAHPGVTITCSIDNGPYTVCPSSYRNLASGSHSLVVRAVDKAGNVGTRSHTWFVVTPPVVVLDQSSDSGHSNADKNTHDNTPQINVSALVPGAVVTVTATKSGQVNRTCTFTATAAVGSCDLPSLVETSWNFTATQSYTPANAGRAATSTVSNTGTVIVDVSKPVHTGWSSYYYSGSYPIANGAVMRMGAAYTHYIRPIWTDAPSANAYLWQGTCSHNGGALQTITSTSTVHSCSVVAPASGLHTMTFTRIDVAGNRADPATFSWTVLNKPVLTLAPASDTGTSATDRLTADNTPTMQVGDLAPGATVTVTATRSGQANRTCTFTAPAAVAPQTASTGSCDLAEMVDGSWSITATQTLSGQSQSTAALAVTVDTTRPVATAPVIRAATSTGAVIANDSATTATTAWIGAVPAVTGATVRCRLDGTVVPCPTTNTAFPNLGVGSHVFEVIATDAAGNVGVTSTTWRILGKPVVALDPVSDTGAFTNDRITRDNTPQITVTNLSGGGGTVTVTATKAGSTAVSCTFVPTTTSGSCSLPTMVDGTWTVSATESVRVGASTITSSPADLVSVTIDTVAPTKPTTSLAVNGAAVTAGSVVQLGVGATSGSLTFATAPSSEAGATLLCSLDGGSATACPAGGLGTVANGAHALTLTAVDLAGNESTSVVQWAQVEQVVLGLDPSGNLKTTPGGQALTNSRMQTVSLSGLSDLMLPVTITATNGSATVTCTVTAHSAGTGSCVLPLTADGTWTLSADQGVSIPPSSATLIVDTTQPTLTAALSVPGGSVLVAGTAGSATQFTTAQTTLDLAVTTSDAIDTAPTLTCVLDGGTAGPCPTAVSNLTYGEHTLQVTSTDDAGNTRSSELTWFVASPPAVRLAASSDTGVSSNDGITRDATPTIVVESLGRDVDVVVTASRAGQPDVVCYLWHANETGSVPGSAYCDLGTMVDGTWSITATQTISGRPEWKSPASLPVAVTIDTIAPANPTATFANSIASGSTTTQTSLSFTAGPTSTDAHTISYTCVLNGGAASSCGAVTGLTAGTHSLTYSATDLAGNAAMSKVSWTVIGAPIVALKPASNTGVTSDAITNDSSPFIEVSSLIPGANVTVTAIKGAESVTCTFTAGAPAAPTDASSTGECQLPGLTSDGSWSISAMQTIGGTASAASPTVVVTLDTQPPVMGGGNPDITATAGGSAVVNGGGTEQADITFTLPASEVGASRICRIDSAVTACPSAAAPLTGFANGVHTLEVVDTDVAGNVSTSTFTWAVVGVPTVALAASSDSAAADGITSVETPEFTTGALISGATVEVVATQGSLSVSCSFVVSDGVNSCSLPPLADGNWTVKARQGFGTGWSVFSSTTSVTVDATDPADLAVTLSANSRELMFADGDETATSSATITVAAPSSTDAHSVTYSCALNGAAASSCATSYASLPSGVNRLIVTATDVAGNSASIVRTWSVIAPPVVTLATASDTGTQGDGVTADQSPTFDVANLMPGATVTVTASRAGSNPVTCTFTVPAAIASNSASTGSCALGSPIAGRGWTITASQTYVTSTTDPADAVSVTSATSAPYALDVVQPHEVAISAPVSVSVEQQTITVATRSVPMEFLSVTLTSLSPTICTVNSDGDVVLLAPGTCTLRGSADGGDDGAGTYYDAGLRTVSFTVLAANTVSTVPASAVVAANPGLIGATPTGSPSLAGGNRPQRPQNSGSGGENGAGSTQGLRPPPQTTSMRIDPIPGRNRARVVATVRQDVPGAPVRSVVFVVFDETGKVTRRVVADVADGQTVVEATVPYANDEYQIRPYTTNEAGVSAKAPIGANVLNQPTTLGKRKDGTPILFGKEIAKPVIFGPDSPDLDTGARRVLDGVVKYAAKNGGRVFITGFVRNQGGSVRDQKALSNARAEQVATYLSRRGVDTWIRFDGFGAYRKGQGQPQDRRVEVRWSDEEIPGLQETRANSSVLAPRVSGM